MGSVVQGNDNERIARLLSWLRSEIDERAARFAKVNAGSIVRYRQAIESPDEPRILLLLDGAAAFRSAYEGTEHARWFDVFRSIASDGRQVGVHVIMTADRPGIMPSSVTAMFQRRVVLRMADANDYALMGLQNSVPEGDTPAGRGVIGDNEIQVAVLGGSPDLFEQARAMKLFGESMRDVGYTLARSVERLPELVSLSELPESVDEQPSLGIAYETLQPLAFPSSGVILVAGPPVSGKTATLITMVSSLRRHIPMSKCFLISQPRSDLVSLSCWDHVANTADDINETLTTLARVATEVDPEKTPVVLVVEGLPEFVGSGSDAILQDAIKNLNARGHLVIVEGEITTMTTSSPLLTLIRNERTGLLLAPDQMDGNVLRSQLPKMRKGDFPVGRGVLIVRGGAPTVVQVAFSDLA